MKDFFSNLPTLSMALTMGIMLTSANALAKTFNLYDQPKSDSKIVGSVDGNAGIITIYQPKTGDWIKVADPRNGNVGWMKTADLNQNGFSYHVVTSGNGSNGYQIIQYGNTKPYTAEQMATMEKEMRHRREAMRRDMQWVMHDMMADLHHPWMNFPMIVPVLVVPEKEQMSHAAKEKAKEK